MKSELKIRKMSVGLKLQRKMRGAKGARGKKKDLIMGIVVAIKMSQNYTGYVNVQICDDLSAGR